MAEIKNKNFSFAHFVNKNPTPENGDHFINCNLAQPLPHTAIFTGVTGLMFTGCNLVNCDIPMDSDVDDCLHIHKNFCTHKKPKIAVYKDACTVDCEHKVDEDEVIVDGQSLGRIRHYANKGVV